MATLTRQELYDLIWSQPRTTLATRLGLSDVALGKLCIREGIPAPPRGYWAKLEAGKGVARPTLPIRLPGQEPDVVVTPDATSWRPVRAGDPLPPEPFFPERVEDQIAYAMKQVDPKFWRQPLSNPHAALRKVLDGERRRRARHLAHGYSWERPLFDAKHFQRQLRIFNCLAHGLSVMHARCEVRGESKEVRARETHHYLTLTVDLHKVRMIFQFDGAERLGVGADEHARVGDLVLVSGHVNDGVRWIEDGSTALEQQLLDVMQTTLTRAEERLRRWARRYRETLAELIEAARKKDEAAAVERQRIAAEKDAVAEQARRDDLTAEAARWHQAAQIRAYIAHLDAAGATDAEWRAWALQVADEMDPTEGRMTTFRKAASNAQE
ncbi:hypothetical protein [Pseudorhodoferax sp.]|uniref:hypothetical protein n=1 Tax=Pseudorhodoferax sp. TaxID=1993553 RepID=UPI002DD67DEF|nr:hypothetical protein [Pseudorhodoferax sp.]